MILKYRAYIDGKFYYFDLEELILMAQTDAVACTFGKRSADEKLLNWIGKGNQPDVFTGMQDKNNVDIYEGDILGGKIGSGLIEYNNEYARFVINILEEIHEIYFEDLSSGEIEIIGNIHQHGEILK